MLSNPSGYDSWSYPFWGRFATKETRESVLCDSRTCSCGAIALAAPVPDSDEIVGDALNIFGVQIREESRSFDSLMIEDIRRAGVEIREGHQAQVREGFLGEYLSLWFRKSIPSEPP